MKVVSVCIVLLFLSPNFLSGFHHHRRRLGEQPTNTAVVDPSKNNVQSPQTPAYTCKDKLMKAF